jgi:eukaryotic-like serine/threonine-protein kinase
MAGSNRDDPTQISASSQVEALAREIESDSDRPSNPESIAIPLGTIVGDRYRLMKRIGLGGMGEVFLAEHVVLGKPVAVKVLLRDLSDKPAFVKRFKLEAIAASQIGHQHIVDVSDFGETPDGHFYFVMEYLDGETLDDLIRRESPLRPDRALRIVAQVARALGAAHAKGLVHRDVKPQNVLLVRRDGVVDFVKLVDFGVAKPITRRAGPELTVAGTVVGTPQYMSPEQALGSELDARSDIYSLGVLLHRVLSGQLPFNAESSAGYIVAHVNSPPPPLPEATTAGPLPPRIRDLVLRMLAKAPEARVQSMSEVVTVIDACLADPNSQSASVAGNLPILTEPPQIQETLIRRPRPAPPERSSSTGEETKEAKATVTVEPSPARSRWPLIVVVSLCTVGVAAAVVWWSGNQTEGAAPESSGRPPRISPRSDLPSVPPATKSPPGPSSDQKATTQGVAVPPASSMITPAPTLPMATPKPAPPIAPAPTVKATPAAPIPHVEDEGPSTAKLLAWTTRLQDMLKQQSPPGEDPDPVASQLLAQARQDAQEAKTSASRKSVAHFLMSWEKRFLKRTR